MGILLECVMFFIVPLLIQIYFFIKLIKDDI